MSFLPKDVILMPEPSPSGAGIAWIAMNVFTRSSIAMETNGVETLSRFGCGDLDGGNIPDSKEVFKVWEISCFSNQDGLLADPSRFVRDSKKWGAYHELSFDQFVQILKKNFILIDDQAAYLSYFGRKKSILDGQHIGNLHDQIGSFMTLSKRRSPSQWWVEQKFKEDLSSTRDNTLYGAVENNYLELYFHKRLKPGMRVLDLGCGIGYFSSLMAKSGAEVVGLDPNADYIKLAKDKFGSQVQFEVSNIGRPSDLSHLKSEEFDFIFMSDALLFYFVPISEKDQQSLPVLLGDIRRLLKPKGTFSSVESHPVYYQAPWLGAEDRPFTIKTEYAHKKTGVVPTFSEMGKAFTENGFAISWVDELYSSKPYSGAARDFNFAREFPLWILFEMKKGE